MSEIASRPALGEDHKGWQTPGIILRRVRRERGLDVDNVCERLGLTQRSLKALESDDYEKLPAKVYVRGYIRRYCELLDIRTEPVLESFESYGAERDREVTGAGKNSGSKRIHMGKLALMLLGLLVLLALLFWATGGLSKENPLGALSGQSLEIASAAVLGSAEPVLSATDKSKSLPNPPAADDSNGDYSDVQLLLQFSGDSWVEVTDAGGKILAVELQKAGSELQLSGAAPFAIELGYGPGVRVLYWGDPVVVESNPDTYAATLLVGE